MINNDGQDNNYVNDDNNDDVFDDNINLISFFSLSLPLNCLSYL